MTAIKPFTDEQARALINLAQRYEVWIEAERALATLPYDLRRKTVSGRTYLYEIADRSGNGKSLGAWDEEKAERFERYRSDKAAWKARRDGARQVLNESSRLARASSSAAVQRCGPDPARGGSSRAPRHASAGGRDELRRGLRTGGGGTDLGRP